jgi:exonuclease SbcC
LAAALNAGNLNTAALVIFLSLHLIESTGPQLLLLDDPIQNIDDVHVTQLAALMRELVRTRERQMIVAVHERALFDYLQLELGPTRAGDSMLAIELARDAPINVHRKEFSPGAVAFGG